MKPKVYISRLVPGAVVEYLAEYCECEKWDAEAGIPRDRLLEFLADQDGLLTQGTLINQELLDAAPKLKIVSNMSVGYDNFDLEAMKARHVLGTHTPGVLNETVADLIFALMLSAARRVPEMDQLVRQGKWQKGSDSRLFGIDVHHATLGIIGMGRIGEAVARRGRFGFGMKILYCNRNRKPQVERELDAAFMPMNELLEQADYVVIMTPATAETHHLIGREELRRMKPTAILINASRGAMIDQQALAEALRDGVIRAAGLDVYEKEPVDANDPLLRLPNVVLLPHLGSGTAVTRGDMAMLAARNLVAGLSGQRPPNLVPEMA